jgi:hypothetical protein
MQPSLSSSIRKLIEGLAKGSSGSHFEEAARRFDALPLYAMCLVEGAERYPELSSLLPVRPPASVECKQCRGTGWVEFAANGARFRCCECRALGRL